MVYDEMEKLHDEHMRGWYNAMQTVYDHIEEMKKCKLGIKYDQNTLNHVQAYLKGALIGREKYE